MTTVEYTHSYTNTTNTVGSVAEIRLHMKSQTDVFHQEHYTCVMNLLNK